MTDRYCAHGKSMELNCLDCWYEASVYDKSVGMEWAKVGPEVLDFIVDIKPLIIGRLSGKTIHRMNDLIRVAEAIAKAKAIGK